MIYFQRVDDTDADCVAEAVSRGSGRCIVTALKHSVACIYTSATKTVDCMFANRVACRSGFAVKSPSVRCGCRQVRMRLVCNLSETRPDKFLTPLLFMQVWTGRFYIPL